MEGNQQPAGPASGPGMNEVPQADPAAERGPDSHSMPSMSQALGRDDRDYEKSYNGLNAWVQTEFRSLRREVEGLSGLKDQLGGIQEALHHLSPPQADAPAQEAPQADAPEPQPEPSAPDPATSALDQAMARMKAEQYRDTLLDRYTRPGAPGEGLPPHLFRDNIPVHPPHVAEDGGVDDSAQRKAIESFIESLNGIKGETKKQAEEALMEGVTPGSASAPPVPGDGSAEDLYQQFTEVSRVYGSKQFDDLDETEQARIRAKYYELLADERVQERHEGQTGPTMSYNDMARRITELSRQVKILESGKNPLAMGT